MSDLVGNPEDRFSHDEDIGVLTYKMERTGLPISLLCHLKVIENHVRSLNFEYEHRSEKTDLRGFRPGPTQTGLYSHRRWLET